MYVMQIRITKIVDGKPQKVWESIKASHATEPYKYADYNEAERQLHSCYPDLCKEDMRVIKVFSESTKAIVAGAKKFAEEKRAQGWTRDDSAEGLRKMLESDTGEVEEKDDK